MDAKDLMVGDLVTFKDCQNDEAPIIVKIWQINAAGDAFASIDGGDELDEISIDDEVVGIPLTPEILEKNGFKRLDKGDEICIIGEYVWGDKGKRNFTAVRITCYKGLSSGVNMLTKIETDCSHESGINMVHSCDIECVHELQHSLRLCGIDKEIML